MKPLSPVGAIRPTGANVLAETCEAGEQQLGVVHGVAPKRTVRMSYPTAQTKWLEVALGVGIGDRDHGDLSEKRDRDDERAPDQSVDDADPLKRHVATGFDSWIFGTCWSPDPLLSASANVVAVGRETPETFVHNFDAPSDVETN